MHTINFFNTTILENKYRNWLIKLENDDVFYMTKDGVYLPTTQEKTSSQKMSLVDWDYAVARMKLVSIKPTGDQVAKIRNAFQNRNGYLKLDRFIHPPKQQTTFHLKDSPEFKTLKKDLNNKLKSRQ